MATPQSNTNGYKPGQALTAGGLDEISRSLDSTQKELRYGRWNFAQPGMMLPVEWTIKSIITRVYPDDYPPALPPWARDVYYDVQAVGMPDAVLIRTQPRYLRPAQGTECRLHPALLNDLCGILQYVTPGGETVSEMVVWTERPARRTCRGGGGGPTPVMPQPTGGDVPATPGGGGLPPGVFPFPSGPVVPFSG